MKFEIKNVKVAEFASEETFCFEASLYVDGARFCVVSNDGHGGPDNYYPVKGATNRDLYREIERINSELDKTLESVVADLVAEYLIDKDIRRTMKRIAYTKGDGMVYALPAKYKPTEANLAAVKRASWWMPGYTILNEQPMEELRKYFY